MSKPIVLEEAYEDREKGVGLDITKPDDTSFENLGKNEVKGAKVCLHCDYSSRHVASTHVASYSSSAERAQSGPVLS